MWIFEVETLKFLDVNLAAVKHYGYSKMEFLHMEISGIRPKEDIDQENKKPYRMIGTCILS